VLLLMLEVVTGLQPVEKTPLLLAFLQWCESTAMGEVFRTSSYAVAMIMATHVLGLALLGGAVVIVDLRMLGAGLATPKAARLSSHARPWLVAGLVLLIFTGALMLFTTGVKYYYNPWFWVKMSALPVAVLFTLGVRDRVARNERLDRTIWYRLTGAASLGLWFLVAAAGRWVGFS
jgi:hypothetical protein